MKALTLVGLLSLPSGCGGKQTTRESKTGYAAYIVRVNVNATAEQLRSLASFGPRSDKYNNYGADGLLFRMTKLQLEQVDKLKFVVSVERLRPSDKVDADAVAAMPDPAWVTIDTFDHLGGARRAAVARELKAMGAIIEWVSRATLRARIAKKLIPEITALDDVVWIEPATSDHGPKN